MLGRDRNLAIVFQVELRQSVKFMERFSSTLLQEYLGQIRLAIEDGQKKGLFRRDINATAVAKMFFGALDEMATNWMLSRRRYNLESDADTVVDFFSTGHARDDDANLHPLGGGARRRHHGRADCRAPGQCRRAGPAARSSRRKRRATG